jgi:hypothetical protein
LQLLRDADFFRPLRFGVGRAKDDLTVLEITCLERDGFTDPTGGVITDGKDEPMG